MLIIRTLVDELVHSIAYCDAGLLLDYI